MAQIIPVLFYYIGRYASTLSMEDVLRNMKWPLLFAVVCGLYFFVQPPAWYMQMKMDQTHSGTTDFSLLSIFRLSSFWGHPYQIGYATLLFLAYLMYGYISNGAVARNKFSQYVMIAICIICLLLAQLRVTIAVALLMLFYFIFMLKKDSAGALFKTTLIAAVIVAGVIYYIISSGTEASTYIIEHTAMIFNQDEYIDRFEHTAGGITEYSMFGNGFGRYGFVARETGGWALVDHEFQRHLAELGYLGISFLSLILLFTGKQCIMKKELTLETGVFFFFFIAMFGASILSNEHQYNFIFWFCLGKIWNNKYIVRKPIEVYERKNNCSNGNI